MKICVVTGGSGGHIYPAITFADTMKARGHDVVFIGNDHKMESWIVPDAGYPFLAIHNQGLQGSKIDKIKAVLSQFKAIKMAKKHLQTLKPDVVVAFGGYVSAPVSFAASKLHIPLILHEQNAFPGKANKMVAGRAQAIITCYEEAFKGMDKVHYLGNPRASLIHEVIDSKDEIKRLGLKEDLPIVLCVMGSQGSTSMNDKFKKYVQNFNDDSYQVIITTGPLNIESFKKDLGEVHENVVVTGFVDQKALLPVLSLIVCRSGASTIAEIQSFGIPSLLIPSPHVANNHQFYNAKSLFDKDACAMIEEKDIHDTTLNTMIPELLFDKEHLNIIAYNVKELATPNAANDIAELVEKVVSACV
ncbi:undecaprenyldiphospho-muramoylpentapeptide beta-N-acetylglucosaminyltransferase [Erysipelothrix sp. HDW6A]|uniref:undecaprenyldiphospho-muramoylpentapeptide beta-N-acetylglucosaminyltransferase n=1 Tax=Erysipelothrix sp. HDW6A TaxID=2714928 RepID=UPI0014090E0A|nr:undecaprenyldiphospho-muramoylpentapeptide beta-N-acetylglucosaminyltransferase [Erysipelothrix sp. HDW6A]QIK57487.1 undecaprenyldiphospho-muramoylpentapeptide beta-N-acetylglucosaminyltransferase [Erysipelothrix sp. HDW6A]